MPMFVKPHGGMLKQLIVPEKEASIIKTESKNYISWDLTERQLLDIELILNGAMSPLEGFMNKADYESVLKDMRLSDGTFWPMPITLDVTEEFSKKIKPSDKVALRDHEGVLIAVMEVRDLWMPDKAKEAEAVYGSADLKHQGVNLLFNSHPVYAGGVLKGVELPKHYDFNELRNTPLELRERFKKLGWSRIMGFHTLDTMHRAEQALTFKSAQTAEANLLLHPAVGVTRPGDNDYFSRVRCYEHIIRHYPEQTTALSLLPLASRMSGPREVLWNAIIRKNYGCTHFIAGSEISAKYQDELGIQIIPFDEMAYVSERAQYVPISELRHGEIVLRITEDEVKRRLDEGLEIPEWFSHKEVITELRKTYPPRHRQGFTIFFTGLSGAGKSTVANILRIKLMELGGRPVTMLDGDIVRKNLSSELGFSREHRDLNIIRIGFVASEITKNGGIAICAPIAPYASTRAKVRALIETLGGFLEVYVSTPIDICEERDRKGLYAKARAGLIKEFTGISDPYEAPENPELAINTGECTPDEAAQRIILKLEKFGYLKGRSSI
ncbi:MAG: bifunctional sulfate adenylyltransferase/adenylylsulfate kinase [Deltaproteobacteria bacterium]|nr:bifunctional sulfate adenylyltransferase/adenylylsulfate kinase [Deltaproteobacteria bacterium]